MADARASCHQESILVRAGRMFDPAPSAYRAFAEAGCADAWNAAGTGDGYTCCQADDLLNPTSILDTRTDVLLLRGGVETRAIDVVGDDPSGLWPSDHAGVVASV